VHQSERGAVAVGEFAEYVVERQLDRQVVAEGVAAEHRDQTGAGEVAGHHAGLPAAAHIVLARRLLQVERLAGRLQRRDHLFARRPALDAAVGAQLEPVGAALDDRDLAAALDHVEHGIAAARPRMQLDVRIGDQDLVRRVLGCGDLSGGEQRQQQPEKDEWPPHQFAGATNGSL
jgi:hypothetical protein